VVEMDNTTRTLVKYAFGVGLIVIGLLFESFGLGYESYSPFGSVGSFLIFIGFGVLLLATIKLIWKPRKKIVDERMEFVAAKAMRVAFVVFVIAAFILIIIDGITPITMPVHLLVSYVVCLLLVAYVIAYTILLKYS